MGLHLQQGGSQRVLYVLFTLPQKQMAFQPATESFCWVFEGRCSTLKIMTNILSAGMTGGLGDRSYKICSSCHHRYITDH